MIMGRDGRAGRGEGKGLCLPTRGQGSGVRDFKGLAVGVRVVLRILGVLTQTYYLRAAGGRHDIARIRGRVCVYLVSNSQILPDSSQYAFSGSKAPLFVMRMVRCFQFDDRAPYFT
jgi:hypothetical protein